MVKYINAILKMVPTCLRKLIFLSHVCFKENHVSVGANGFDKISECLR